MAKRLAVAAAILAGVALLGLKGTTGHSNMRFLPFSQWGFGTSTLNFVGDGPKGATVTKMGTIRKYGFIEVWADD